MRNTLAIFAFLLAFVATGVPAHAAIGYSEVGAAVGVGSWGWSFTEVDYSNPWDEWIDQIYTSATLNGPSGGLDAQDQYGEYYAEVYLYGSWVGEGVYAVYGDHWGEYNWYGEGGEDWEELGTSWDEEYIVDWPYPDSETSSYLGADTSDSTYGALFSATLAPSADYSGRYAAEDVNLTYEDCSIWGTGEDDIYKAITNDNENWSCCDIPGWLIDGQAYAYGPYPNVDDLRIEQGRMNYLQTMMTDGACTAFSGSQAMWISSCSDPMVYKAVQYDSGHSMSYQVYAVSNPYAIRGSAGGPAE